MCLFKWSLASVYTVWEIFTSRGDVFWVKIRKYRISQNAKNRSFHTSSFQYQQHGKKQRQLNHMFNPLLLTFFLLSLSFTPWRHENFSKYRFGYDSTPYTCVRECAIRQRVFWTPSGIAFYFIFIFFLRSLRWLFFIHFPIHYRAFFRLRRVKKLWLWRSKIFAEIQTKKKTSYAWIWIPKFSKVCLSTLNLCFKVFEKNHFARKKSIGFLAKRIFIKIT